jgi:hypothetical protein
VFLLLKSYSNLVKPTLYWGYFSNLLKFANNMEILFKSARGRMKSKENPKI